MITTPYTWIELSTSALKSNLHNYKRLIGAAHLGVVVKSNAYGHGIVEIARMCQDTLTVTWLYTTSLSEALLLRSNNITKNILVMAILDGDLEQAVLHNIDLMVYELDTVKTLDVLAKKLDKKACIHIKVDTGISRFGLYHDEVLPFIIEAQKLSHITIRGIFTHLAQAETEDQSVSISQIAQFNSLLKQLADHNIHIPIAHASNSAGAAMLANGNFNAIRLGAGAYGLWPSQAARTAARVTVSDFELTPVMTWKTKIMQVRTVPAQSFVGYGRTHQTTETTKIGLLPIGYYEGYDRRLSNKGQVYIEQPDGTGTYAPVIGRVCMNVTMIDLSHIPHAQPGTDVTLLGAPEYTQATHIVNQMASFNPREFTTRLHPGIVRIVVP